MASSTAFAECVDTPDHLVDLGRAALLIAREEYPDLDVDAYLAQLDMLAATARRHLPAAPVPQEIVAGINKTLFLDCGFAGNTDNYYDPRNSFLNDVLDRRLGIPISLSLLFMEVGRRLGLHLEGISFPGHFLVKLPLDRDRILVLDPFFGGVPLSENDLTERLQTLFDVPRPSFSEIRPFLESVPRKEILARLLRNLRAIYIRRRDWRRAASVSDRILLAASDRAEDVRDRGLILERLECFQAAINDYRHYLRLAPDAADFEMIRGRLLDLHHTAPRLN